MADSREMKYFTLTRERKDPFPQDINWNQTVDVRKITREEYQKLSPFLLLPVRLGLDGIFPDVIETPFLLLSRTAMEVIAMYVPDIPFLFVALFDTEKGECTSYYLPVLEEQDCLAGQMGPGRRELTLDRRKLNRIPLFRVRTGIESAVIIRMDLAESLLERDAIGLKLKEVSLV